MILMPRLMDQFSQDSAHPRQALVPPNKLIRTLHTFLINSNNSCIILTITDSLIQLLTLRATLRERLMPMVRRVWTWQAGRIREDTPRGPQCRILTTTPGSMFVRMHIQVRQAGKTNRKILTSLAVNVKGPSNSGSASVPSTPRGPPRKPRQSGHALWVGNLPSATIVSDLKDHFSRDATKDIESVFLISKSNCAFVNYRTEEACAAAMARFHDSRFQGIRLVCRLRRSSAAASVSGIPTGPAALMPAIVSTQTAFESIAQNREISSQANQAAAAESLRTGGPSTKINDKYFIMKSLTVEDIQLSIRNSIWATQSHNEDSLNKAYEVSIESIKSAFLIGMLIFITDYGICLPDLFRQQIG